MSRPVLLTKRQLEQLELLLEEELKSSEYFYQDESTIAYHDELHQTLIIIQNALKERNL
jgi:hypothetical protein